MKYISLFEEFTDKLLPISDKLRISLDKLKQGFNNNDEILNSIEKLGFVIESSTRERTSEYTIKDPSTKKIYTSSNVGYVRVAMPTWGSNHKNYTPLTRYLLKDSTDRLLMILRIALKSKGIYNEWKQTNMTVKDAIDNIEIKQRNNITINIYYERVTVSFTLTQQCVKVTLIYNKIENEWFELDKNSKIIIYDDIDYTKSDLSTEINIFTEIQHMFSSWKTVYSTSRDKSLEGKRGIDVILNHPIFSKWWKDSQHKYRGSIAGKHFGI